MNSENLTLLNSIQSNQRWINPNESSVIIGNRSQLSVFQIINGSNSLAKNINAISLSIIQDYDAKKRGSNNYIIEASEKELLEQLSKKIATQVEKYNASHGILYRIFMMLLNRNVDYAFQDFKSTYETIQAQDKTSSETVEAAKKLFELKQEENRKKQLKAEELRLKRLQNVKSATPPYASSCSVDGKYMPKDETYQLEALIGTSAYLQAVNEHKLRLLSSFIHLLPLGNTLECTSQEIIESLKEIPFENSNSINDRKEFVREAAIRLVENKRKLCWKNDWSTILTLLYKSQISSCVYHGTNLISLEFIKTHGLGSETRDYALEELKKYNNNVSKTSAAQQNSFYVAGVPTTSFIYGNASPEWLLLIEKNRQFNSTEEGKKLCEKYRSTIQFSLIQIKLLYKSLYNPNEFLDKLEKLKAADSFETQSLLNDLLFFLSDNHKLDREMYSASSVSYYNLPKFQEIKE